MGTKRGKEQEDNKAWKASHTWMRFVEALTLQTIVCNRDFRQWGMMGTSVAASATKNHSITHATSSEQSSQGWSSTLKDSSSCSEDDQEDVRLAHRLRLAGRRTGCIGWSSTGGATWLAASFSMICSTTWNT
eukprot:EG_transcript_24188